jgi:hypothetical protein
MRVQLVHLTTAAAKSIPTSAAPRVQPSLIDTYSRVQSINT